MRDWGRNDNRLLLLVVSAGALPIMLSPPKFSTPDGLTYRTCILGSRRPHHEVPAHALLMVHGNGFCAQTFEEFLHDKRLTEYPHPLPVIAVDLRGHGVTATRMPGPFHSYRDNGADLLKLLDHLVKTKVLRQGTRIVPFGHSSGSTALLWAMQMAKDQSIFAFAFLIEPILVPHEADKALTMKNAMDLPMVKQASKRRKEFPDKKTALETFLGRGVFADWAPLALAGYIEGGLTDSTPTQLCCDPKWEASNFIFDREDDWELWKHVATITVPCAVFRGGSSVHTVKKLLLDLCNALPKCEPLVEIPNAHHCPQCVARDVPILAEELLKRLQANSHTKRNKL